MELTILAALLAAGTLAIALALASWLLPLGTLPSQLLSVTSLEKPAARAESDGAPDVPQGPGAACRAAAEEAEPPKTGRAAAQGSGCSSAAPEGFGKTEAGGSPEGIWALRALAVGRLVDRSLAPVAEAQTPLKLKRAIWALLDDRPRLLASGCADGQARLFDLRTGRLLVSVRHDTGARRPLTAVLLSPGPLLFTGSWDGRRHTWDAWPRRPARPSEFARGERGVGHENSITGIALSRDGKVLACACLAGCVLVYRAECPTLEVRVSDGEELEELQGALKFGDHGDLYLQEDITLGGVDIERNFALLPQAGFSGCKSRRDVGKLKLPTVLHFRFSGCLTHGHKHAWRRLEHDAAVLALSLSWEGCQEFLYSGSRDQTVRKWELMSGSCVHTYKGHTSMVRCLAVNAQYLVTGGDDRTVRVWQKAAPVMLRSLTGHRDFVRGVALCSTCMERLVSASDDMNAILWNADTGERLRDFRHDSLLAAVVVHESVLITAADDGRLRLWGTESGVLERQLNHPAGVTAISIL